MKKILCVLFSTTTIFANAQTAQLTCYAGGASSCGFLINNYLQDEGVCNSMSKKINIAVLDSCSFLPWTTDTCVYPYFNQLNYNDCVGNSTCFGHPQPFKYFQFECLDSVQMTGLQGLLNHIPNGDHVLAFTFAWPGSTCPWPSAMRTAFMNLGSNMFNTIADTVPFIFYVKKGFPFTMHEVSGLHAADTVNLMVTIECLPASVEEKASNNSTLTLFPNPATKELKIQNVKCKIESIEIYDMVGQKVLTISVPSFSSRISPPKDGLAGSRSLEDEGINVSTLPSGIYFITIKTNQSTVLTKKFVKQ